jgi:hypothetical protein
MSDSVTTTGWPSITNRRRRVRRSARVGAYRCALAGSSSAEASGSPSSCAASRSWTVSVPPTPPDSILKSTKLNGAGCASAVRGHTSRASPAASAIHHRIGNDAPRAFKGDRRRADSSMMRTCVTLLVSILFLWRCPAVAQEAGPLPLAIRQALDASHPGWRIAPMTTDIAASWRRTHPNASPNVLQADYDGDGHTDYSVLIHHAGRADDGRPIVSGTALAFLRRGSSYQSTIVTGPFEIVPGEGVHLWPIGKGADGWNYEESRAFVFERDAIAVELDNRGPCFDFVYRDGAFVSIWSCD